VRRPATAGGGLRLRLPPRRAPPDLLTPHRAVHDLGDLLPPDLGVQPAPDALLETPMNACSAGSLTSSLSLALSLTDERRWKMNNIFFLATNAAEPNAPVSWSSSH
jgi:hypothetical protein